jgi:hypothetical protein
MIKKVLLILSILSTLNVFAQSRQITLDWGSASSGSSRIQQASIIENSVHYNTTSNTYSEVWRDDAFVIPNSLRVTNIVYENISVNKLSELDLQSLPSQVQYTISSNRARNEIYTTLSITPIINQNGVYRKVVSVNVDYSKSPSGPASRNIGISNSLLASGQWYRFKIDKSGVYKIDRNFLNSLGMDVNSIDPRRIKIYGNGGNVLPLRNSENLNFDLVENAIQVVGEENGSFDSGDYILFYGENFRFNQENNSHINPYDDNAYYFITADGSNGKRISNYSEPTGSITTTITQFNDYQFFEKDELNPPLLGRRWFSNRFDINNQQDFEFNFPNIIPGQPMEVRVFALATAEIQTTMAVEVNDQLQSTLTFGIVGTTNFASSRSYVGDVNASSETVKVTLKYNNAGNPQSNAFLDFISVNALRQLTGGSQQFAFRFDQAAFLSGIGEYQFSNASQYNQIWDVTSPADITRIQNENNAATINFKAQLGQVRRYIAVHNTDYYTPIRVTPSNVPNQNLKGTIFLNEQGAFQDIDYLIVTPPMLLQPALRLANHHRNRNGLRVKVVTTDKIYNEFNTGKQDIAAIRNFVKYIYDNASSPENRIKYLNLFGDTSVDYKNRLQGNNNMVPTFNVSEIGTISASNTYMSDDFFGMMDPNEGTMVGSDKLDIAVGRMVVDNVILANDMVNKVIRYQSEAAFGNWRSNFVLVSDDADTPGDAQLQFRLDSLGNAISFHKPFVNVIKIHSDSYQQETSSGGNRYPKVNEAIENAIDVGSLVLNYFGHGGEDGLASERIITKESVQNFRNRNKYPLFVTVTCSFTRFDNPLRPTGGEFLYWNKEGGAIALIATTRQIGVSLGTDFNQKLGEHLYAYFSDTFIPPAEALRRAKNQISNVNRRVIFYVGDPAMELAFPKKEVRLTTINGVPIGQSTDTLKALSRIRMGGEVVDPSGNLVTDYNGILEAKVFDKRLERQTLGNDGTTDSNGLIIMDFETLGEGIFNGQASITGGQFEFEFVVPRDIAIPVGEGRVSLYAKRNNSLEDQAGANETILVGGLNENAPDDNQGPRIRLFMNDESFVNGGITNNSPILIAKLEDENGINTASGIGHDITAILDGDETNPFILNDYYQAEVDDFTKGSLNYRLRDLEEGLHTLTLKAWDVYNNSSTAEIQFVVAGSNELKIDRVLNYPNPFVSYTEFWFNHNRPFEPLEVQVQVFTVTGKVVWTRNQIINTEGFLSRDITWDGRDDFGDRIGKGVYVYKLTVKSTLTNKKVEKFEKLVIL